MEPFQTGKSAGFGFGHYSLPQVSSLEDELFRPATSYLQRIARTASLGKAWRQICDGPRPLRGVDGVNPRELDGDDLEAPGHDLRTGRYRPTDLLGMLAPGKAAIGERSRCRRRSTRSPSAPPSRP